MKKISITPEQMAVYRATAQQRQHEKLQSQVRRQERGLEVARLGAKLLKKKYGAKRVVLFGSLLDLKKMHENSDVDIAVWGIEERQYLRALAELLDLDPNFSVDLIEAEYAQPRILETVNTVGIEL